MHSTEGMIACTQPLAARCGLKILEMGGNAAVSLDPTFKPLAQLTPYCTGCSYCGW